MAYNTLKKIKFVIFVVILMTSFSVIATQQPAYAQEYKKYELLEPLPCIPDEVLDCNDSTTGKNSTLTSVNMAQFFQYGFNLFIAIAGVAAVFMMVWGGFLYITSDSWFKKDQGKTYFQNAIYGLLMILCSYLILRTVNPKLVSFPRTIPVITSTAATENPVSLFEQLNKAATNYNVEARKFVDEAREADTALTALKKEKGDVEKQIFNAELSNAGLDSQTTLISELKVKLAKIDDQIKENEAKIVAGAAKATITNAGLSMTTSGVSNSATDVYATALEVSSGLNLVEQQRLDAVKRLNQMQAPQEITAVNEQAVYAKAMINLTDAQASVNRFTITKPDNYGTPYTTTADIKQFKADVASRITKIEAEAATINNAELKQKMLAEAKKAKDALEKKLKGY
ncbi:MAG: hypothetical protein WCV79_00505 [Candidatus Paceibacterota bacterium]|jgi:hypothetical protein